jgi:hypothetical protein
VIRRDADNHLLGREAKLGIIGAGLDGPEASHEQNEKKN